MRGERWYTVAVLAKGQGDYGSDWKTVFDGTCRKEDVDSAVAVLLEDYEPNEIRVFQGRNLGRLVTPKRNTKSKGRLSKSSFFPGSDLSDERRQEILDWVDGLSEEDWGKLRDLQQDTRDAAEFDTVVEYEQRPE